MGQIVENAKPFFFEVLNNGYAKDNDHAFQYGRIVDGIRPFSFPSPTTYNSGPMIMQPTYPMYMGTQTYIPMGGMPVGGMPMGGMPVGAIPMGGIPMGAMPIGGMPMGGMPMGGIPMPMPSYEVRNHNVFFGNEYVPDISWVHFKDLGQGYGML